MQDEQELTAFLMTVINDFSITPAQASYAPGTDVVFSGVVKPPGGDYVALYSDGYEVSRTNPGGDGKFQIAVTLPAKTGIYAYRAYYSVPFPYDSSFSDTITVNVAAGGGGGGGGGGGVGGFALSPAMAAALAVGVPVTIAVLASVYIVRRRK